MMNRKLLHSLRNFINRDLTSRLSSSPFSFHHNQHPFHHFQFTPQHPISSSSVFPHHYLNLSPKIYPNYHFSFATRSHYSTIASAEDSHRQNPKKLAESNEEVEPIDLWEEEDETEPEIGDGGDGGGVVLQNCPWGEKVLSIAQDVLLQFGDDIEIFAFKTSPGGYIYVRLDRLCNEYGCPSMEDIQSYSQEYKKKLDEAGAVGDIPSDLALEVSSPGADRLLRIPDDLQRFQNMAMRVKYVENDDPRSPGKEGIFFLESIETESGSCVWRLADVKENRDPASKGRPMTRKQKDWRLNLPYEKLEQVTLYLDYQ
ncbi:putative ribosome maturation factor RimP [Helianthus anomalus]